MCGSAMEVDGSNFKISGSYVSGNGLDEDEPGGSARWSDGITLLRCDYGKVLNNQTNDNSDIGIVVGGGNWCEIAYNTIDNFYKRAFGGLHIGSFQDGGRTHPNGWYHHNITRAGVNKQATGLAIGFHPWGNEPLGWAGDVVDNESYGAVVNMVIDGIEGGYIHRNIVGGYQGWRGIGCNVIQADYTAGHFGAADIQSGYLPWFYDCW